MKKVTEILEEVETAQGTNAKIELLEQNFNNNLLKKVLVTALDPFITFYVNKVPATSKQISSAAVEHHVDDDVSFETFIDVLLNKLSTREITGNAAKSLVADQLTLMSPLCKKWAERVLKRNLRLGIQSTTINKVWPNAVKKFTVQLAETLKTTTTSPVKILDVVNYPVVVEPKLDGLRLIICKKNGEVTLCTRNGTSLETLPTIKKAIENSPVDNVIFDGEALAETADWNTSVSVLMSSKSKKDDKCIIYNVFDWLPLNEWESQKSTLPFEVRVKKLEELLSLVNSPNVKQVKGILANSEDELWRFYEVSTSEGHEGVMVKKPSSTYEFRRSDAVMKLKPVMTCEGVISGSHLGRVGTKYAATFGGFSVTLLNGVVTNVGSGFNDNLRAEIQLNGPETYVGKIVECEYQPDPTTQDGLTRDGKMRFPVFIRFRHESDADEKLLELKEKITSAQIADKII